MDEVCKQCKRTLTMRERQTTEQPFKGICDDCLNKVLDDMVEKGDIKIKDGMISLTDKGLRRALRVTPDLKESARRAAERYLKDKKVK